MPSCVVLDDPLARLGTTITCRECGAIHALAPGLAIIAPDARARLPAALKEKGFGSRVLLVTDAITEHVAGVPLQREFLRSSFHCKTLCLTSTAAGHVEPNAVNLDTIRGALLGIDVLVAVGTGTISDLVKLAAASANIPSVLFCTAMSINGITSDRAVMVEHGMRKTYETTPPAIFCADVNIIAAAPAVLNLGGLADLFSFPAALSDWKLSELLCGSAWCPAPLRVARAYCGQAAAWSPGIAQGAPSSIEQLAKAVLAVGSSVTYCRSSATVSGSEHLLSYYWDLINETRDRPPGPHGFQVALATVLILDLYEQVREELTTGAPAAVPAHDDARAELAARFGEDKADELLSLSRKKKYVHLSQREAYARYRSLLPEFAQLPSAEYSSMQLRGLLQAAGAFPTLAQLGLEHNMVVDALRFGRHMRDRICILDVAHDLGLLAPERIARLVDHCCGEVRNG